jgi:putative oxidoreductase
MTYATASLEAGVPAPRRRAWNAFLWVLQIAAAAMFLSAGAGKLTGEPAMVQSFEQIGLGQWFRFFTGGLEVLGAVLLLIPSLAAVGASLLGGVMVGAVLTHLFLVGGSAVPALVLLLAVAPIAVLRRGRTLDLVQRLTG